MSIIEKFVAYHKTTDPVRRREVENILATIMRSDDPEYALTPEQEADLEKRLADPNNTVVPHHEIEAITGMKMPS